LLDVIHPDDEDEDAAFAPSAPLAGSRAAAYTPPLWYSAAERVAALLALIVSLPVILAMMVAVRIDSPGPALFFQDRIAQGARRPFRFLKIRTMHADARARWPELYDHSYTPDQLPEVRLTLKDDPRVTRVGKVLRRTSLDELPNFWHVVTGDMRLVGPRPELWDMLPHYDTHTLRKFDVKPGITGYAQVLGRGDLTFVETVDLDLAYVREAGLATDLWCLRETVIAVFQRRGAY
jgi:lipopolysaccharide/colanic/teichoic acid biosynthesis glycosyltransferase